MNVFSLKYFINNRLIVIPLLVCGFFFGGCGLMHFKTLPDLKKEAIELKKKKYAKLSAALANRSVRTGIPINQIKEMYGEPDSIFNSGSTQGSFEIWTYDDVANQEKFEDWHPIRLYFDNSKLIDWRY